jgi:hypothetical protein
MNIMDGNDPLVPFRQGQQSVSPGQAQHSLMEDNERGAKAGDAEPEKASYIETLLAAKPRIIEVLKGCEKHFSEVSRLFGYGHSNWLAEMRDAIQALEPEESQDATDPLERYRHAPRFVSEKDTSADEFGQKRALEAATLLAWQPRLVSIFTASMNVIGDADSDYGYNGYIVVDIQEMIHVLDPKPQVQLSLSEEDRAKWETIRQAAINAFASVTWEQAQEYLKDTYELTYSPRDGSLGTEWTFGDSINWHILSKNEVYINALKEFLQEHPSPERNEVYINALKEFLQDHPGEAYTNALKEILQDHPDKEREKGTLQSTVSITDARIETVGERGFKPLDEAHNEKTRGIDVEPER